MAPPRIVHDLTCDESFRSAAGKVIWSRFEEMMSFQEAALAGVDIEGVHDMRVASRRLRAALEMFDVFPRRRIRPLLRDVKRLADALGAVRDTDVMSARLERELTGRSTAERAALDAFLGDLGSERERARQELRALLARLERQEFARHFLSTIARETM